LETIKQDFESCQMLVTMLDGQAQVRTKRGFGNELPAAEGWKPPATIAENRFKAVHQPASAGFHLL
jgi:hypothetical protein